MKRYWGILLIVALTFQQCDDSGVKLSGAIRMRILEEHDVSCGLPLVEFYEGADKVKKITGSDAEFFVAHNLDQLLAVEGKEYKVAVRETENDELGPCLAIGIAYPWVTILMAEEVE
jgi:hypothetical protein